MNFQRNPAHHQYDLIGLGGNILVEPSLQVGKAPLNGIGANSATANLICYEDEGGVYGSKAVKFLFHSLKCIFNGRLLPFIGSSVEEEVSAP